MSETETQPVPDPIPPSEPAVPSLPGPDLGVFRHEIAPRPAEPASSSEETK